MLARRRNGRIGESRNHYVDVRPAREAAILRFVISTFHVIDTRRDGNSAAQVRPNTWQSFEVWQAIEREVYFSRRAAILVALEIIAKVIGQVLFANHFHESQTRINAGRN